MKRKTIISFIATVILIGLIGCGSKTEATEPVTTQAVELTESQEPQETEEENIVDDSEDVEKKEPEQEVEEEPEQEVEEASDSENYATLEEAFNDPDRRAEMDERIASLEDERISVSWDVKDNNMTMTYKILDSAAKEDGVAEALADALDERADSVKELAATFDEILGFEAGTCTVTVRYTDPDDNVLAEQTFRNAAGEPTADNEIGITPLDKTMYASQSVNLREGDGTTFDVIGQLYTNQSVHVIGKSVATGWYKIDFNKDQYAFVSDKYLTDNPVEIAVNNSNNVESANTDSSVYTDNDGIIALDQLEVGQEVPGYPGLIYMGDIDWDSVEGTPGVTARW